MLLVEKIEAQYASFSPKEKKIATYLLQEQDRLGNISIQELSQAIGVSAATITRFCRKVGAESFVELKMELLLKHPIEKRHEYAHQFNTVSSFYSRVIERTADLLDEHKISMVLDKIVKADRILIYGIGSSGLTAKEFAFRLSRIGMNALAETDAHMMIISSSISRKGDVVIGFSNSGETNEIVHALRNAQNNGSTTIAITSIRGSSLASLGGEIIMVHPSSFVNNDQFVNSQLPFHYFMDILTLKLLENPEYASKLKETAHEILKNNQQNN